jgi:hypothetical protein
MGGSSTLMPDEKQSAESQMFPRLTHKHDLPPIDNLSLQVKEHHSVLTRHGRIMHSHSNQLVSMHETVTNLEDASPLGGISERLTKVEHDLLKLRTAIYIVGALLTSGYMGGKVVDRVIPLTASPPQVIQLSPEAIKALQAP